MNKQLKFSSVAFLPAPTTPPVQSATKTSTQSLSFGRLSPSSVGSEPWKFLVIQNKELREKLKPIAWGMANTLDDASHVVIIVAKKNARYDSDFLLQTLAKRNLPEDQMQMALDRYKKFQVHDMKIADDERALFEWTRKNTYIALANMLTGAAMLGIDSCPVEGMDYDAVTQLLTEEGLLDPEDYGVSVAATFGYRSREIDPEAVASRLMGSLCGPNSLLSLSSRADSYLGAGYQVLSSLPGFCTHWAYLCAGASLVE